MSPRFEGSWMIAPSGSGKTNAMLHLINDDLQRVVKGECSVIVMDSAGTAEGRLLYYLSRHKLFAPGQPLHDRLIYIEPDVEHPLALNLFDVGLDTAGLTPNQKREAMVAARDTVRFLLSGLLGLELTKKQGGVYRYLVEALMHIPNATIYTLAELLTDEGYEKHRKYILKLDHWARTFFETRFRTPQRVAGKALAKNRYLHTKAEIFDRIDTVLSDDLFRSLFSHAKNKVHLFEPLQRGSVVIINANNRRLGEEMMEVFGRFWIAQLAAVATRRLDVPENENLPVYIYIDEAHQYLRDEPKIVKLLDELARKNRLGFFFAHQRIGQVSPAVLGAFASTAIRWAARPEEGADFIAARLQVEDTQQLVNLPRGTFATLVREANGARKAIVNFPKATDAIPLMSEAEFALIERTMWMKYSGVAPDRPDIEPPPHFGAEDQPFEDPIEPVDDEELGR